MTRGQAKVRRLYQEASRLLAKVQPERRELFVCPLCLREFSVEAIADDLLSVEHVVPSALGGAVETLTCTECNNTHGSTLDSHVVRAMAALDGLSGKGHIRGVFHNDVGHIAVNVAFRTGAKGDPNIVRIVGEASKWDAIEAVPDMLFDGATLSYTLNYDFVPLQYWRGLLRIAYLACFRRFGYVYALSKGGAQVRRALEKDEVPVRAIMSAHPDGELLSPFLICLDEATGGNSFFVVVFGVSSAVRRHFAVLLPTINGCEWDKVSERAALLRKGSLTTGSAGSASRIRIRFGDEPITQLREFRIPRKATASPD